MGTNQVATRPRMSINDFMVSLRNELTDGEGAGLSLQNDQWWIIYVECWCLGEDKSNAHIFRRNSRSLYDLEETLFELYSIMYEEDTHPELYI